MKTNRLWRSVAGLGVAAALAVPTGALVSVGMGAAAGATVAPPAAKGAVTCSALAGKITFNPPLTLSGSPTVKKDVAKIRVAASACKATKGTSPKSGTVSGRIVTRDASGDANACTGLEKSRAFTLTIAWNRTPAVEPSVVSFSSDAIASNQKGDEGFTLPGKGGKASVAGSYAGPDHGATSSAAAYSNDTAGQLASACGTGLSQLKLVSGSATLK